MFEFSQYLGFLLFLTILTIGFWLMFFLVAFVQYWVGVYLSEAYKEKKDKKGGDKILEEINEINKKIQNIKNGRLKQ